MERILKEHISLLNCHYSEPAKSIEFAFRFIRAVNELLNSQLYN